MPSPPALALSSSSSCCTTAARRNRRLSNRRHKNCRQKNNCGDALILLIFALSIQAAGFPMGTGVAHGHGESLSRAICFERISTGSYIAMAAFPDDSGRVLLASQDGKMIWLVTVPKHHGSLEGVDDGNVGKATRTPFLDLSDIVHHGADGLEIKGIALHPEFTTNGRLYISYTYNDRSSKCGAGTSATGAQWCRRLVVAEFFSKDYKGMTKTVDNPKKVKTIFSMALPQEVQLRVTGPNQGGQILFKHTNNRSYIFIAIGHGVIKSAGGYVDLSSDKSSLLGKVIRVDINYSPGILPHPEVVAMGVGDPKGCSFDTNAMRFMYCSLVVNGTAQVRLIDIESGRNTLIYQGRLPKITGGFNYRASTDPSLEGRYIYIYNSNMCTATETPEGSGHYDYTSARITMVGCSASSPMACDPNSVAAIARLVHFIGEDNNGDVLFFTTMGIYRLVHPALCHYPTVDGEPPVARVVGKDVGWPSWARVSFGVFSGGVGLVGSYVIWACIIKRVVFSGTNDGSGQEASSSCAMNNSCSCSNNTFNCMCPPM